MLLSSAAKSASLSKKQRVMLGHNPNAEQGPPRVAAAEDEAYDQTARELLAKKGFDPKDVNKFDKKGRTPMMYFCSKGNLTMVRYLVNRDADCRKLDRLGGFPMFAAAVGGHLETMKFLSHECGAHEDIRRVTKHGFTPLRIALFKDRYDVVWWLLLNEALSSRRDDAVDGGGIDDMIMRRDLRHIHGTRQRWKCDHRLPVLAWAQASVAEYENVKIFLTGTIVSAASSSVQRHPKNPYATRSHKRRKVVSPSSSLVIFNGTSGILELIADYVAGTKHQLRTLRQLIDRLPDFIADVPFIEEEEEDEDEEDY